MYSRFDSPCCFSIYSIYFIGTQASTTFILLRRTIARAPPADRSTPWAQTEPTLLLQDSETTRAPRPSQTLLAHLSSTFQSNTITRATTTCRRRQGTILCPSLEPHTTTHHPTPTAHNTPTSLQVLAMVSQMALCPLIRPRPHLLSATRPRLLATISSCNTLRPQEQGRPHHSRPRSSAKACHPTTTEVDLQP